MTVLATLPLADAVDGPVFDRQVDCPHNDRAFAAWESPLVWHHQESYLAVDQKFQRQRALHFAFEQRTPEKVWSKGWHIWYDNAVLLRERPPGDCLLEGAFALEEVTAGFGGDNVDHIRPWTGIVARMQDLRRYYYLCLEYPDAVVLYRRDDRQWVTVARRQVDLDVWTTYRLKLECRGDQFRAWCDDRLLFRATDYAWAEGWAGLRATCTSFVTAFSVSSLAVPTLPRPAPVLPPLPAARVVREIDLGAHGQLSSSGPKAPAGVGDHRYNASLITLDPTGDGGTALVVDLHRAPDGATHLCCGLDGALRWKATLPGADLLIPVPAADGRGQDLVAIGKDELLLVDGGSGQVRKRAPTPRQPNGKPISASNCPTRTADLDGCGKKRQFFLTINAGGETVWVYDCDLTPRLEIAVPSGCGHGQHLSVCDVDGDGTDEFFAGCALIDGTGAVRWRQDEIVARLKCPNGGHVDASVMGFFDGPDAPPTVHLASSSAGHIVCDARSGEILVVHPQGHVQTCTTGRVVPGAAGMQVIASNRWGGYGVTGIYAGDGRRLARFQPGFVCQGTKAIAWAPGGLQCLLVCDGQGWRGLYDHLGRRLLDLEPLVPCTDAFAQRYDRVNAKVVPLGGGRDGILLRCGTVLRLLVPEDAGC